MNTTQLKYIVKVAEEKSFSKAAQKLYISQPSLSQSVQLLENEFGTKFFTRRPLKLTYAGEVFISWAKEVLSSGEQVHQKISDIVSQKSSKLVIGISTYRSTCILPEVIAKFKNELPNCKIIIEEHPSDILQQYMDDGKIDLLIDVPSEDKDLYTSISLANERLLIAIPSCWEIEYEQTESYPLIDLLKLQDKQFILLSERQRVGKIARKLCAQCQFEPDVSLECHNIETACAMVSEGLGVAFIPELFVKNNTYNSNVKFYAIKNFLPEREIAAVYNKNRYLPIAAEKFIELLKDFIQNS